MTDPIAFANHQHNMNAAAPNPASLSSPALTSKTLKLAEDVQMEDSDKNHGDKYDKMKVVELRLRASSRGINYRKLKLKKEDIKVVLRDLDMQEKADFKSSRASPAEANKTETKMTYRKSPTNVQKAAIPQSRNPGYHHTPNTHVRKDLKTLTNRKEIPSSVTPLPIPTKQLSFPPPSTVSKAMSNTTTEKWMTIWSSNMTVDEEDRESPDKRALSERANAYREHIEQIRTLLQGRYETEYHQPLRLLILGQINQAEYTRMTETIFENQHLKALHNELIQMILVFARESAGGGLLKECGVLQQNS
jgi:hypothetical protein